MSDLRRIILWLVILIVPGGIFLLPALFIDAPKNGFWKVRTHHA
jgi:hypothetical protein